ncbi:MAG TPA: HPr family phosphocarrier protein [Propionibacteriaceae bacterium]|jgi:phosphocarrier protein HPr
MPTRTVIVASSVGLHARPAALLASAVNDSGLDVTVALPGGDPVDAGSILEVMTLGAAHGDTVTLSTDGDGADGVLDSLVALLSRDLDNE